MGSTTAWGHSSDEVKRDFKKDHKDKVVDSVKVKQHGEYRNRFGYSVSKRKTYVVTWHKRK